MGRPRVCVVTDSDTIKETVKIVLGQRLDVSGLAPSDCTPGNPILDHAELLIISGDFTPPQTLVAIASRLPVLRFGSPQQTARLAAKHGASLPLSFRPEQLRHQVEALLRRAAADAAQPQISFLDYPILPREVARLARRAATTNVPVLISGEAGTGKSRLARAMHASGGAGHLVSVSATRFNPQALSEAGNLAPGSLTLYVTDIALLEAEAQRSMIELCERGGFESSVGWHDVRLVCGTRREILDLAADELFESELFYRLSVLPVTLPPLRQRLEDIADIVTALARDLGESLPHKPYAFTAAAIERMERYMWFGNLAELEAVMLRTMAMAGDGQIDADDLLFDSTCVDTPSPPPPHPVQTAAPEATSTHVEQPQAPPPGATATESVDLVIQELAHEFRNPMVTIKTLTQRLEKLLEDKASRDQVTRLTGEAVDRMDRALENLLQFTRFGEPASEAVALSPLVTSCLSQLSSTFTERQVLLNYEPPEADFVTVDSAQVSYALENLLRVVLRDLRDGDTLSIHPLNSHGISLEFPARGQLVAEKLAVMVDGPQPDPSASSIGFMFAKALVERNGGKIEIHPETGRTIIAVALPGQGETSKDNGHAPYSGRR